MPKVDLLEMKLMLLLLIYQFKNNVPTPENKFEKFDVLAEEEVSVIIMCWLLVIIMG